MKNAVSIVIPAFNEEKLLPHCLDSLKHQDFPGNYEIIVVDNASTDSTARIAAELGARVISCQQRGVAYARQAGARAAEGDIIVQADADTLYPIDWLSRIVRHFAEHSQSIALAGGYVYQDEPRWAKLEYLARYLLNLMGLLLLRRPVAISGANFAFRRSAFLKTDGYNPEALYPDQWGISHSLSHTGKIFYDNTLSVFTSTRRVQKPFHIVLCSGTLNLYHVMNYFFRYEVNLLRKLTANLFRTKSVIRRTSSIFLGVIICLLAYGYIAPGAQVFGKVYYDSKLGGKVIALSFDDGPNEPYTSEILDVLNRYQIKATFFVIGRNIELYSDTARRMVKEGDILGNHTYYHLANHAIATVSDKEDIGLAQQVIFDTTGVKPHLYRPPHGKKSPWELRYVKAGSMIEVTWSDATNETHDDLIFGKPDPDKIARAIVSKARPGKIILLHDGYGTEHNNANADKSLTVQVLPVIIEALTRQGYHFVTIPELLRVPAYNP